MQLSSKNIDAAPNFIHIAFQNLNDILSVAKKYPPLLQRMLFWSPLNAGAIHGPGWFIQLIKQAQEQVAFPIRAILDCGNRADIVQLSLSLNVQTICFKGEYSVLKKLEQISVRFYQSDLWSDRPPHIVDLANLDDRDKNMRQYLNLVYPALNPFLPSF